MDERRKCERVHLRCALVLWSPREGTVIQTETENISSEGLYFVCGSPFKIGEQLEGTIQLPWRASKSDVSCLSLQCSVDIVRIQERSPNKFGIGCRFLSYTVLEIPAEVAHAATTGGES